MTPLGMYSLCSIYTQLEDKQINRLKKVSTNSLLSTLLEEDQ